MARKGSGLLSLAAGFADGAMGEKRRQKADTERQEDRSMRRTEHDARMGEVEEQRKLRVSLADAARPVQVEQGAGGSIRPETMDNRDVGLPESASQPNNGLTLGGYRVKDKTFDSATAAAGAAAAENSPDAVAKRQGAAYRQAGQPGAALEIEQKQASITSAQAAAAKRMKDEGFIDAARASRTGDPQAVFDAFNKGGTMKLETLPTVTPVERDLPGVGKVTTYDYVGKVMGPDGTPREVKVNSHDLSMQTLPYEKVLEFSRKGVDSDRKFEYQNATLAAKEAALAARTAAAEAKSRGGGGATTREERLRFTSLFQDAGRRAGEAQRAMTALQKDPDFQTGLRRNPNGPQAQELATLRDSLKAFNEERSLYQGLLAGSQGASLADAKPKTPEPAPTAQPAAGARPPAPAAARPDFSKLWTK